MASPWSDIRVHSGLVPETSGEWLPSSLHEHSFLGLSCVHSVFSCPLSSTWSAVPKAGTGVDLDSPHSPFSNWSILGYRQLSDSGRGSSSGHLTGTYICPEAQGAARFPPKRPENAAPLLASGLRRTGTSWEDSSSASAPTFSLPSLCPLLCPSFLCCVPAARRARVTRRGLYSPLCVCPHIPSSERLRGLGKSLGLNPGFES